MANGTMKMVKASLNLKDMMKQEGREGRKEMGGREEGRKGGEERDGEEGREGRKEMGGREGGRGRWQGGREGRKEKWRDRRRA